MLRLTSKAHYKTDRQAGIEPRIDRYKINWLWGLMSASAGKPA
jgi:hypothetical protein